MKRFEYKLLEIPSKGFFKTKVDYESLLQQLNDLGKKGWEVVNFGNPGRYENSGYSQIIILKKEIF